uniref:Uncharacterized protein n=1 Tax=Anopheles atroparvus TaxID=41427 RepID=A0A182ILE7_ANOAO
MEREKTAPPRTDCRCRLQAPRIIPEAVRFRRPAPKLKVMKMVTWGALLMALVSSMAAPSGGVALGTLSTVEQLKPTVGSDGLTVSQDADAPTNEATISLEPQPILDHQAAGWVKLATLLQQCFVLLGRCRVNPEQFGQPFAQPKFRLVGQLGWHCGEVVQPFRTLHGVQVQTVSAMSRGPTSSSLRRAGWSWLAMSQYGIRASVESSPSNPARLTGTLFCRVMTVDTAHLRTEISKPILFVKKER